MLDVSLQMMPGGGVMPSVWSWGPMWLTWVLLSIAVTAVFIFVLTFYLHREKPNSSTLPSTPESQTESGRDTGVMGPRTSPDKPSKAVLAEVIKSLAPTLLDDERRVMDELVKAGGEVLQSDLPRLTDFSKATVSKAIHGLETRGIVLREKHKWTYWCKLNPRLVERTLQSDPGALEFPDLAWA